MNSEHLDKELLSAFLDNKLLGQAKTDVINHLRQCEECRLLMAETSIFLQELKRGQAGSAGGSGGLERPSTYRKLFKYVAPLALAASVVLVLIPVMQHDEVRIKALQPQESATEVRDMASVDEAVDERPMASPEPSVEVAPKAYAPKPMPKPVMRQAPVEESAVAGGTLDADTLAERFTPIYFEADSLTLSDTMQQRLKHHAKVANAEASGYDMYVMGHTDSQGSDEYNMAIGMKYAQIVKEALVALGVEERRIISISYGEQEPVCHEQTTECMDQNRRVEFRLKPR